MLSQESAALDAPLDLPGREGAGLGLAELTPDQFVDASMVAYPAGPEDLLAAAAAPAAGAAK